MIRRTIQCGFQTINTDFLRDSVSKNGKSLWKSGHVLNVKEEIYFRSQSHENSEVSLNDSSRQDSTLDTTASRITASVIRQTNVTLEPYEVELKVNVERRVIASYCKCAAGRDQCKHIAAVCFFLNNEEAASKTSNPQEWGKPSMIQKEKYKKGKLISNLHPPIIPIYRNDHPFTVPDLLPSIKEIDCPLRYMLEAEEKFALDPNQKTDREIRLSNLRENISKVFNNIDRSSAFAIYTSKKNMEAELSPDIFQTYNSLCKINTDRRAICIQTLKQSYSHQWKKEREGRITATKAARISCRKTKFKELAEQLISPSNYKSAGMTYGTQTEKEARHTFENLKGVKVIEVGLVVSSKHPWLACSPDGVVVEDNTMKLLEVKCPYSCKDKPIIDWDNISSNVPYLIFVEDLGFQLNKKHSYYTQIQVSLYVLQQQWCFLYIYSKFENDIVLEIERDEEFLKETIPKLENFYFKYFLPELQLKLNYFSRLHIDV